MPEQNLPQFSDFPSSTKIELELLGPGLGRLIEWSDGMRMLQLTGDPAELLEVAKRIIDKTQELEHGT